MFPLYTKTFGGKIGKHLHSVSPGNNSSKKFKMASLKILPPKTYKQSLVQKIENKMPIWSSTLKESKRYFSLKTSSPNLSLNRNSMSKYFDLSTFFARDSVYMLTI